MKVSITIWMVLLINTMVSCAHTDPGLRMLDIRAGYTNAENPNQDDFNIHLGEDFVRKAPIVKKAWLHAHEMPNNDYFAGGFIHFVIMEEKWQRKSFVDKEKK